LAADRAFQPEALQYLRFVCNIRRREDRLLNDKLGLPSINSSGTVNPLGHDMTNDFVMPDHVTDTQVLTISRADKMKA
jgi:hypothetical protein